jgi:hypothetical protein
MTAVTIMIANQWLTLPLKAHKSFRTILLDIKMPPFKPGITG